MSPTQRERLLTLLDAVCDQRASARDMAEVEQLVLASDEARWLYLTYLDLHGSLIWDAASSGTEPVVLVTEAEEVRPQRRSASRRIWAAFTVAAAILLGIGVGRYLTPMSHPVVVQSLPPSAERTVADNRPSQADVPERSAPEPVVLPNRRPVELSARPVDSSLMAGQTSAGNAEVTPRDLTGTSGSAKETIASTSVKPPSLANSEAVRAQIVGQNPSDVVPQEEAGLDDATRTARRIDRELAKIWKEAGLEPSPLASDTEWLRRVMLDVAGRIPTIPELEELKTLSARQDETDPRAGASDSASLATENSWRPARVERLLSEGDYIRNFSTIWLNLLVGRSPPERVDREALQRYLRRSFAENRPWNAMVADLLSAEGRVDQNGATNYLVAHLNNQAVPATAITARLFLGQQLHCAQCHHHPFNQVQQSAFWELNSLFQQTAVVNGAEGAAGQMEPSARSRHVAALITQPEGGPIYYETTNGLMKVAFPRFNGQNVDPAPEVNRRQALAQMLTTTEQPQLAAAFVNRMWAHFFGAGFTTPVDDMGTHNPPVHPEVLNLLRDDFIQSGYDIRHLIRVITSTAAYQRSSRPGEHNLQDDPVKGDVPYFSRVYQRPLNAEQLYDSLVTASRAHEVGATDWTVAERQRRAWLDDFVISLNNDENDEAETLSGTYSQALTLMNGDLIHKAIDVGPASFLGEVVRSRRTEPEKIRQLCLAALSRPPTTKELSAMQRLVRESGSLRGDGSAGKVSAPASGQQRAYQDLFWALLNSNEFSINH